jgi:hypothetical protein
MLRISGAFQSLHLHGKESVQSAGSASNLTLNGGFELGRSPWQEASSGGYEMIDYTNPHSGSYSAWLCGYGACNDTLTQTVTLPGPASQLSLQFFTYIRTQEPSGSGCLDHFHVYVKTVSGSTVSTPFSLCNTDASSVWGARSFDLSTALQNLAGQQVQISFQASTIAASSSDFFVDDVSLVSGGGSVSTPTATPGVPTGTPTATTTLVPSGSTDLVVNGGFEAGQTPWHEQSSGGYQMIDYSNPHAGSYSAWLCGYNLCTDRLWQVVSVPSSASGLSLNYWLYVRTSEAGGCADSIVSSIQNAAGSTLLTGQQTCDNAAAGGWTHVSVNANSLLPAVAGQQIQVNFRASTNSSLSSDFFVDDVSLIAASGIATPTPTPSNTRTVTASPTLAPSSTPTTTGSPSAATMTSTSTPTLTATAGGQTNLIVNGGFEQGQSPWQEVSGAGYQFIDYTHPHAGSYEAWLCGYNSCSDQLWQTVAIPTGTNRATLAYYLSESTQEGAGSCNDSMAVRVRTTAGSTLASVQTVCDANTSGGWISESVDLSSILALQAGHSVEIAFVATSNASLSSDFFVDDVSLKVAGGTGVPPTPTPTGPTRTPTPTPSPTITTTPVPQTSPSRVSSDPFGATISGQHQSEVEPDTYSFGSTLVSAFQVGRFYDGGSTDVGWATYSGGVWHQGLLPGLTTNAPNPGVYDRATDPSVTYDRAHQTWMISTLAMTSTSGVAILISRSSDGINWSQPVVAGSGSDIDKDWIACDEGTQSPYYGHCYLEWDDVSRNDLMIMSTSTNGGSSWGAGLNPSGFPQGLGGQPEVQPNGTVMVPAVNAYETDIIAFRSTDGGQSWGPAYEVSSVASHNVGGFLRSSPLPSAEIDGVGRVYVAWQDCRFEASCLANDIVASSSVDGTTWTTPVRVPIDAVGSNVDHFIPGLAADPTSSGSTARLALTYYYYPDAGCAQTTCQLDVGYITSTNGGATWSVSRKIAGPMQLAWLPSTNQGSMVGDYMSTSFLGAQAMSVFAVASAPSGSTLNQGMYVVTETLSAGQNMVRDVRSLQSRARGSGYRRLHQALRTAS